jgi:eukaryotic translation initiation factor 2C
MFGRSLYSSQGAQSLGGGLAAWSGIFSSLRPTQMGLVVNVDVSATAFTERRAVVEIAQELWRERDLSRYRPRRDDSDKLKDKIKLLQVEVSHLAKRRYRVMDVGKVSASETFFTSESGKKVSVVEYFRDKYNIRLTYPNLPCLLCGEKKNALPMEICTIVPGKKFARRLDETQTASMIKFANQRPNVRQQAVNRGLEQLQTNNNTQLADLGLQVDRRMISADARVLEPPAVEYKNGDMRPTMGVWNMRDRVFINGGTLNDWAVLVVGDQRFASEDKVKNFVSELVRMGRNTGVNVTHGTPTITYCGTRPNDIDQTMKQIHQNKGGRIQLMLCIVRGDTPTYASIKFNSDVVLGFPSQCILVKNIFRPNPQYLANVWLKVNAKLNGRNLKLKDPLPYFDVPTMVFGADVTHPSPGARAPSIAAVVGSLDRWATQYSATISLQSSRQEEIADLKNMVKDLLLRFRSGAPCFPQRIVFFRDGVSEGQFAAVQDAEIRQIHEACMAVVPDGSYRPALSFIVLQKRHHVRLFPNKETPTDRSGNVAAGTVVDTQIVDPNGFDFYLMSHSGIQGMSRPVHYHVLHDEIGFSSDQLQKLCNNLCYTYARCTRSVSIVPPVYYAHLVAFRARFLAEDNLWADTSSGSGSVSSEQYQSKTPPIHANLAKCMFFC